MTSQYSYGIVAEKRLMAELEEEGFAVTRAASSKGNFDLIAIRKDVLWLISVKRVGTWKRATTVYRAERRRVAALEVPATPRIRKVLAIWADKVGEGMEPQRGGLWYCIEHIPTEKQEVKAA